MRSVCLVFLIFIVQHVCPRSGFVFDHKECLTSEYTCGDGECISKTRICDGIKDCKDDSDEHHCEMYRCEEPDWYRCADGECISSSFRCDKSMDCPSGSDEQNCEDFVYTPPSTNHSCEHNEWMCADRMCIPLEFVCNGDFDCMDKSDEDMGCKDQHACDGFRCRNGHCISEDWVCDGAIDCADGSDEIDCDSRPVTFMCILEKDHYPCRDNSSCIPINKVCDNIPHCKDKSDEGVGCQQDCTSLSCAKHCVKTPEGPRCVCPSGFHNPLNSDFSHMHKNWQYNNNDNCTDINECAIHGMCSQRCENTIGSYKCLCDMKYTLSSDKKSCKVNGGEALLLFSSRSNIRGLYLESKILFQVIKNQRQIIGVEYDGNHVYWTDVHLGTESILRSLEDGSQMEVLLTSGLSAPEDLALDWLTGNIYFTDAELMHIGVCSNDGKHCTIIVNENIHKPRAIALYPGRGQMFWSDWGDNPQIATSSMDGSSPKLFVSTNLHWPNGISIDIPNKRLYWVDAKLQTIESINLDGTDRRIVLKGVTKHPYAIAIFEDQIYWSDWDSKSIQSCNKFTCKNRVTVAKESKEYIYGIHIYHSALQPKHDHPCMKSSCSHLCLIKSAHEYSCACPEGKELSADKTSCRETQRQSELIIGAGNLMVSLMHQKLGRHELHGVPMKINMDVLTYNSLNGEIIVADNNKKFIYTVDMYTTKSSRLTDIKSGEVEAMHFDNLANNLFWIDSVQQTIEVLHLDTGVKGFILHGLGDQVPVGFAIVPSHGIMFVAFRSHDHTHIDRMLLDGSGIRTHVVEDGLGRWGKISMVYDHDLQRVFWAVEETGRIESSSVDGDDRHGFRHTKDKPIAIAILGNDLFWTTAGNRRLYWADKHNLGNGFNKKLTIDIERNLKSVPLTAITPRTISNHLCIHENGGCSHICIPMMQGKISCHCPVGLSLVPPYNMSCETIIHCTGEQFRCSDTNKCIPMILRCNGNKDCDFGEDESDCERYKDRQSCAVNEFQCNDGICIEYHYKCDKHFDCPDKSDEENCENYVSSSKCTHAQFECANGQCIDNRLLCDVLPDCLDGSDEKMCDHVTCESNMFQCQSGSCIPSSWECDGEIDCTDASDEHTFCEPNTCKDNQFTCTNGKCIDMDLKCDHEDDCGDSSDEIRCPSKEKESTTETDFIDLITCEPTQYTCEESGACLPEIARCNGTAECKYGEDERECTNCQLDEFTCNSGQCIQRKWVCDKTRDCNDGSDETSESCSAVTTVQPVHSQFLPVCDEDSFRCKSGGCVDFLFVCNGIPDCFDGSDENGACNTSCDAIKCKHKCSPTPNGPQCSCHEGYHLAGDHLSCTDINECKAELQQCGQICTNSAGSFHCSCYPEFMLRSDKRSCKATGDQMSILYSTSNQIRELTLSPPSVKILFNRNIPKILSLDVSKHTSTLYFSLHLISQIYRLDIKSGDVQYIMNIGKPMKLAVDWITQNIYFISEDDLHKTLRVCHIENAACAILMKFDKNIAVPELVVDPISKYIFYTVTHWWVYDNPITILYRANLDGSHVIELRNEKLNLISGIGIDHHQKTVYYCDKHKNTIESVSYNGSDHRILVKEQKLLTAPNGLDVFENYAYTLVYGSTRMIKCRLFGNYACTVIDAYISNADSFKISQYSKQLLHENACENSNCMYLCVPADSGPKCICKNGLMIAPGSSCVDDMDDHPQFGTMASNEQSTSVAVPIFLSLLLFGAVAGSIFYLYKKKQENRGSIFRGIRFITPAYGQQGKLGERSPAMIQVLRNLQPGKLSGFQDNQEPKFKQQYPDLNADSDSDIEAEKHHDNDTAKLIY